MKRVVLVAVGFAMCALSFTTGADAWSTRRHALAYYYPWFTAPDRANWGGHWGLCNVGGHHCSLVPEYPAVGPYTSGDASTVNSQFAAMHALGLTGVVVSWWGEGSLPDLNMGAILQAARANGMVVAIAFDTLAPGTTPTQNLKYVLQTYGKNRSYLTVGGIPVTFLNSIAYHDAGGEPAWSQARSNVLSATGLSVKFAVDFNDVNQQPPEVANGFASICYDYGTHSKFNQMTLARIKSFAAGFIKSLVDACSPAVSVGTAFPNHNDHIVHNGAGYYVDNYGGETMRTTLAAAIAANPDWLLIVSWNEWGEGSQCEASMQFGSTCSNGADLSASIARFLASPRNQH